MKKINKLASAVCTAALGLLAMTSCEGGDIFSVNSPDWITEKADSIANSEKSDEVRVSPITLGATDNSDAFWASHLDQDIQIESNWAYTVSFTNYTSGASNWNNFYVVLRNSAKDVEYAVCRADNYGWDTNYNDAGYDKCTASSTASADWAAWLAVMNGAKVTVTVTNYGDNTADVVANMVGTDGSTYTQKYIGIGVESADLYLDFTTDGCHYVFDNDGLVTVESVVDQEPVSMELQGVPSQIKVGTPKDSLLADVTAKVTYAEGAVKEVGAEDLDFIIVPDLETTGTKYLVATLNKTMLGKSAASSINANASFEVVAEIAALEVTKKPTASTYKVFANTPSGAKYAFSTDGIEVTATYSDGKKSVIADLSQLTFGTVPATEGEHDVTITAENGVKTTCKVKVEKVAAEAKTPSPAVLGAEDNSDSWWGSHLDADVKVPSGKTYAFTFTNHSSLANQWNNYVIVLRNTAKDTEYGVLRSDNYGWGTGYSAAALGCDNGGDWTTWLTAMNGAKVTVYVTNNGNGTADVYTIAKGTDGKTYTQYYVGLTVDSSDLNVDFTTDGCHYEFE